MAAPAASHSGWQRPGPGGPAGGGPGGPGHDSGESNHHCHWQWQSPRPGRQVPVIATGSLCVLSRRPRSLPPGYYYSSSDCQCSSYFNLKFMFKLPEPPLAAPTT